MAGWDKAQTIEVITAADERLIKRASVAWTAGEDLTTAKTATVDLANTVQDAHGDCILVIERPDLAAAGNLTVTVGHSVKVDGTNARTTSRSGDTQTVANTSGAPAVVEVALDSFGIIGETSVKIGASFATNTASAATVYFALYRA